MTGSSRSNAVGIPDPPFAIALFATTRFAWLWLILRVFLGMQWLPAGIGKLQNPAWMSGEALQGFWTNAVAVPDEGKPVIALDWYRSFIQFMLDNGWYSWFGPLIAVTEVAIGALLIVGAFVGLAAFAGGFMNWNFIMAGTASTNAFLFAIAIVLVLAWKVAGWYGVDRWLLPKLGVPWQPGELFHPEDVPKPPAGEPPAASGSPG